MHVERSRRRHNPPLERTAAAVYFSWGRASRVRRRGRLTAFRYAAEARAASGGSVYLRMRGQFCSEKVSGRGVRRLAGWIAGVGVRAGAAMLLVRPSPWKRRLVSAVRWSLLVG